ncbi:MAG: cyclic nucleotide-binding domain-containing protein [Gammaproteobacteria bacterium]|nr:cyclic nucleotide-binding domain-containing protein [Gammaproteobacteria bacterium]
MSKFLWQNFFKKSTDAHEIVTNYWALTPLFNNIPKSQITELVSKMHWRHFDKGEAIFHLGDQGAGAIMIQYGKVEISCNKVKLAQLTNGDFFGEVALAQTDKRTADAVAIEDTELVYLLKQDVEEWLNIEPEHAAQFLKNLSEVLALRLQKMNTSLNIA